ncbi:ABC transporter substrate-binding protein [Rhodococcus aetherivorans]|uniref:ABC transporter substrate-binding protein n=1 Tax=Rhodococcus aetherivorans TaxID=191292 RepID=UPI00163A5B3A|nr:ABC transporter substrate-binding protein [Rhodococcus aetherivorans]MBC2589846.1 ABC transporter substrate-binding protein [Rhodococcus aetherivorans]
MYLPFQTVLRHGTTVLAALTVTAAAACAPAEPPTEPGSAETIVRVGSVTDKTGPTAFGGTEQLRGIELAIEEINSQKFLGGKVIELDSRDSASDVQTAVNMATTAVADKSIVAMLGPIASGQATGVSPIVDRGKLPTIYTQSGSAGVLVGPYTYRATAPQETLFPLATAHLQSLGASRLSLVYNGGNPTLVEMAKYLQENADRLGFEILSTTEVPSTTQDFGSVATKIAGEKPQGVVALLVGAQNATAMTQLRQSGYAGPVLGNWGAGVGNLVPAGPAGAGMFWATDFSTAMKMPSAQRFTEAFGAKYGKEPSNFAAEGYDAAWMLAHAIKNAGEMSREGIRSGLDRVTSAGFEGAMGAIRFEGNDMRVDGAVVRWDGTAETLVPTDA